jgi:hypothetical protein
MLQYQPVIMQLWGCMRSNIFKYEILVILECSVDVLLYPNFVLKRENMTPQIYLIKYHFHPSTSYNTGDQNHVHLK